MNGGLDRDLLGYGIKRGHANSNITDGKVLRLERNSPLLLFGMTGEKGEDWFSQFNWQEPGYQSTNRSCTCANESLLTEKRRNQGINLIGSRTAGSVPKHIGHRLTRKDLHVHHFKQPKTDWKFQLPLFLFSILQCLLPRSISLWRMTPYSFST